MGLKEELQAIDPAVIPKFIEANIERLISVDEEEFEAETDELADRYYALMSIPAQIAGTDIIDDARLDYARGFVYGASFVLGVLIDIAEVQSMPSID